MPVAGLSRIAWMMAGRASGSGSIGRAFDYTVNDLMPNKWPDEDKIYRLLSQRLIQPAHARDWLRIHGVDFDLSRRSAPYEISYSDSVARFTGGEYFTAGDPRVGELWLHYDQLTEQQLMMLLNRGQIEPDVAIKIMLMQGHISYGSAQAALDLRLVIPAPGQILDMSLRGALDPAGLQGNPLLAEMPPEYDFWARKTGLGRMRLPIDMAQGGWANVDWPHALWALHWQLPTMPEYFEMRRRLRPSINNPGISSDPSGIILPADIGEQVARQNSIHPVWRNALQAIAYQPVSFRHIDLLWQSQQIDQTGMEEILLDHGLAPYYARKVAAARVWKLEKQERAKIVSDARLQIAGAWEIGTISDADYLGYLIDAGETPDQARQSLELARVEHNRKRVDRLIRAIRQQVLTGQISMDQGEATLLGLQINGGRVADYIQEWSIELSGRRRILSARETLKATEEGLISVEGMVSRLRNLRYNDADINVFAGELQLYLAERLSKAAAAAAKAAEKRQREAERAARLIQQAQRESRDALAKHGSPATLERWYCEGLIGEEEVRARLTYLLWPPADIDRMLAECAVKAAKKHSPKQPPAPVPPN